MKVVIVVGILLVHHFEYNKLVDSSADAIRKQQKLIFKNNTEKKFQALSALHDKRRQDIYCD